MMHGSLFLMPRNVQDCCDLTALYNLLNTMKLIGSAMHKSASCRTFQAGEHFTQHVIYAGCSPHLRFEPTNADDVNFCHVALHGPFDDCVIQTGANTAKPRCPNCRGRLTDWRERLVSGKTPCSHCDAELDATTLDWRQQAAVGRILIEIRNVFPGEASPSDTLLNQLNITTHFTWNYAWASMRLDSISH